MKKAISLLLLSFILSTFAACQNTPAETTDTTTTDATTTKFQYKADVPDMNYNGRELRITCAQEHSCAEPSLFADELTGDALNDATYRRNEKINQDYGVKIVFNKKTEKSFGGGVMYSFLVQNSLSGDDISDFCVAGMLDICSLLASGSFYDLETIPHINLEAEWWLKSLNDSVRILNRQYMAVSDMLLNVKSDAYVVYFNKKILDDNHLDYPYQLVFDGEWTFDAFYGYFKDFGQDLNSDNALDFEDRYGLVTYLNDVFFVGSGVTGVTLDEEGIPQVLNYSEKLESIYSFIYNMQNTNKYDVWNRIKQGATYEDMQNVFKNGNSMFFIHNIYQMSLFAAQDMDVGLLPIPKYDAEQENYYMRAGYSTINGVVVLTSTVDTEFSGIMIEVMSAESRNYIYPTYYETLYGKRYSQDEESSRIFDIICSSIILDLDQVYKFGNVLNNFANLANTPGTLSLYSSYEKQSGLMKSAIDKTVKSLLELQ